MFEWLTCLLYGHVFNMNDVRRVWKNEKSPGVLQAWCKRCEKYRKLKDI